MKFVSFNVKDFFELYNENGLKIIVLRNYENLPEKVGNDLDVEVHLKDFYKFQDLLVKYAKCKNLILYKYIKRPHVLAYKFFRIYDSQLSLFKLDLHVNGASWFGLNYLSNSEIINNSVPYKNWFIPKLLHEITIKIFVNMLIGSSVPEKYLDEISKQILPIKNDFIKLIQYGFPGVDAQDFYCQLKNKNINNLRNYIPLFKKALIKKHFMKNPFRTIKNILMVVFAEIFFYLQKNGLFIVVIGPDGVGKTTLAKNIQIKMKSSFKNFLYFHWIPFPFSKMSFTNNSVLVKKDYQKRNLSFFQKYVLSILRLMKNFIKSHLLYYFRLLPELFRDRLILGDRYIFPYFFDPVSVKYYGPKGILKLIYKLIPLPHIVFILKASPEVILNRKKELSKKDIIRIYNEIEYLKNSFTSVNFIELNANQNVDEIAIEACYHIYKFLVERNKMRMKKWYSSFLGYTYYAKFYNKIF